MRNFQVKQELFSIILHGKKMVEKPYLITCILFKMALMYIHYDAHMSNISLLPCVKIYSPSPDILMASFFII